MPTNTTEIADHLRLRANFLYEQGVEFPEYKDRNDAAAKEVLKLETQFLNDNVDPDLLSAFSDALGQIHLANPASQAYRRVLDDVGFNSHFETAEDFLKAAINSTPPT